MDCPGVQRPTNAEFLAELQRRACAARVPLSGGMNLTDRCNLGCVHCYVADHSRKRSRPELATSRILSILDEAAAAGCLFFLITGGEPLLHPDFATVYKCARELGMLVSVFTNGTLVDESHVRLFRELPPRHVEISLYGATRETYEQVTGIAGSHEACLRGIQMLADGGVGFRLKTMLLTINRHELPDMQRMAKEWGVPFRFDPVVIPRTDGDRSPLGYRLSAEDAVACEMANEEKRNAWISYRKKFSPASVTTRYLYTCGTGLTSFHIDASGSLQPCLLVMNPSADLVTTGFRAAWRKIGEVRKIEAPPNLRCSGCPDMPYCEYCPPALSLENGLDVDPDGFGCRMGRYRREAVSGGQVYCREGRPNE